METREIRIVSYNVRHCSGGIKAIADAIREAGPDIAGIQEVDFFTGRVNQDEPLLLSSLSGMPYYRFVPAIDFMGGKYGTLILSKHPIVSFELIRLPKGGKEERTAGHVAVDLDGVSLDFFNTHLAFDGRAERAGQFAELGRVLSGYRRFVLTGDFNTGDFTEFDPIACGTLVNREDARKVTFPGSRVCIDNIVLSEGIEELSSSVTESDLSDHWMLSADIRITF